ncbi:MAG TPA: cytochrome c biogenesis protein CcdA [Candidatus Eisenbacteria bacterium]|nr:cytochrome c biogenesis protein CcdA [Candidatus Eisenbacteria bacterium]
MVTDLAVAFLAGLVSCTSACVLPLLPPYVAYLGGASAGPDTGRRRLAVLGNAGLFVAGFATCFVGMGAAAGLAGAGLADYRPVLVAASGAVLLLLGIGLLAGAPWLMRERRFHVAHRLPRGPLASYVVGLAFAAGWTPCVGPILAAILVQAAGTATAVRGALLLAVYSAGLGLPFLGAAAFVGTVTALLKRIRGAYPALNVLAAGFLIAMGALTLTNRLTAMNGLLPDLAPAVRPAVLSAPAPAAPAVPSRLLGRAVPAVTVVDPSGRRLGLRSLAGRPVVVNFWAS